MVRHFLQHFAIYQEVRVDEHIEGMVDDALRGVLDWNHAEVRSSSFDLAEYVLDAVDRYILGGRAEFLSAGHMREGRPGAQVGHLLRTFQRKRRRHDLPIHRTDRLRRKWTGVLRYEALDDRRFPGWGMQVRTRILLLLESAEIGRAHV